MLQALRELFKARPESVVDDGEVTLVKVLERGWFDQFYQPKIELKSLHLVGAEALVRARHPTRGIVPTALFLPGARKDDLHALTERVILTALGDWETFAQYGVSIKLAVNVPVSALVELPMTQML